MFALSAVADGGYGLVEAVVAANEADVNATYEPFRPDKPVTLAGSSIGAIRSHDQIDDPTVCWAPSSVYNHERWGGNHITNKFTGLTPNAVYRFELHGSENNGNFSAGGKRDYNLFRQNVQVLTNFDEVAEHIADDLLRFDRLCGEDKARARKEAAAVAKKADWKHFFQYYRKAYDIALRKRDNRISELQNPRLL